MLPPKNLSKGSLSNWCDADVDEDADICKEYVEPHPTCGRHNKDYSMKKQENMHKLKHHISTDLAVHHYLNCQNSE